MMYYDETPTPNNRILSLMPSSFQTNFRSPPFNPIPPHSGFATGRFASLNPWDLKRYQEQEIQNDIRFNEVQRNFNRDLYASALAYMGHSPTEYDMNQIIPDYVPQYSSYDDYMGQREQRIQEDKVRAAVNSPQIYSSDLMEMYNHCVEQERKNLQRYEGKSKEEIYQELDKITLESLEWQQERTRRNFGNRYSKSEFRKYLNSSTSNTSWKTITNIDDLEVQLPSNGITSEYAQKRAKFFNRLNEMRIRP